MGNNLTRHHSSLLLRNVRVAGRRTAVRLEAIMWDALREVAEREGKSVHDVVTLVDQTRTTSTLTAGIRVFLLDYYRRRVSG
jgi:predicted DNA-binding ribbon-helix-helix protein